MEQTLTKRRILVADDNLDAASSLGMLLEMMGHEVSIEQPSNKETLIVALTGWTQDDKKQRSQQAGFDFYLIKPVELPALEKLLRDYPANRI